MNDFLLNQMLGRLAKKMESENIRAILVTPAHNGGIEINYLNEDNKDEPLLVGEIMVMRKDVYEELKSTINQLKLL